MAKEETEVLQIGVDIRNALAEMTKFQRETVKQMEAITKASEKMGHSVQEASDEAFESTKDWKKGLEDITDVYKQETVEVQKLTDTIEALEKSVASANDEQKKGLKESLKLLRLEQKEKLQALKEKGDGYKAFKDHANEAKEAFRDSFKDFFNKDLKGMASSLPKALAKTFKAMPSFGVRLKEIGSSVSGRGAERGGAGGMAMKGVGAAMKGFGTAMKGVTPLINAVTKLGPILGAVGGLVVGLVKLFIDLDAKAKAFNKDILASASTTEFLAEAGGDADKAFGKMKDTLKGLRDSAHSLDNLDWGMTPDEHKAVLNVLTQEGVTLRRIGNDAKRSGKSVQGFASELAHVGIAYSRAFGVPLQEINQLQAEMMTEMGADLSQTRVSFQQMTRAAEDSGIAANKFFGMIRGVSQDLSLWGTRMEDAIGLLGRLGKVMNPRNAQKFMQTASQGLKNMGRTERLRLSLLTGQGKMSKLVDRDINRKAKGLAKNFGLSAAELMSKLQSKEGRAELEGQVRGMDPTQQGAIREALIDAQLQVDRKKKGTFGVSGAARTMGPAAALEAMQGALVKFGGGKKLSDIVGTIGGEMMADNLGISEEQLDQMVKFEASMDTQREVLKKQLESGDATQVALAQEALKKAGIEAKTDKELREKIDAAGYDQIMDTLSESDKKMLTEATKTEDLAKKQTDLQQSMVDKLEVIMDWLMNQLYNLLMGIWDTILSFPFVGGDQKRKAKLGNAELGRIADAEDPSKAMASSDAWKGLMAQLKKVAGDPGKAGQFSNAAKAMAKELGTSNLAEAAKMAGIDAKKVGAYTQNASGRGKDSVQEFMNAFSPEEITKILEKATVWTGSGMTKAESVGAGMKALGMSQPTPGAGAASKPSGGLGSGASPPVEKTATEHVDVAKDSLSLSKDQSATLQSIDNQMDKFKMDTGFLNGPYSKATESSVLAAVRTALFEYYMYKDMDQAMVASSMASGGWSARSFSQMVGEGAKGGVTGDAILSGMGSLKPNASGGLVTGVNNGIATVTAAAGEGLASIGAGERILPRGGKSGGDTYQINVNGVGGRELASLIQASTIDTIYEYKRKQRFT